MNISYGIASGNRLANNINQVYVFDNAPISNVQIRCNRMVKEASVIPDPLDEVKGIFVSSNGGWLPDQGDTNNPAGNQFVGVERPIVHDNGNLGTLWNYYASVGDGTKSLSDGPFGGFAVRKLVTTDSAKTVCSNYSISLPNARVAINDVDTNVSIKRKSMFNTDKSKVFAYPNPFYDNLTIEIIGNDNFEMMELTDATGKVIRTKNFNNEAESQTFEVGDLSAGLYFVRLIGKENVQIIRAIKANK